MLPGSVCSWSNPPLMNTCSYSILIALYAMWIKFLHAIRLFRLKSNALWKSLKVSIKTKIKRKQTFLKGNHIVYFSEVCFFFMQRSWTLQFGSSMLKMILINNIKKWRWHLSGGVWMTGSCTLKHDSRTPALWFCLVLVHLSVRSADSLWHMWLCHMSSTA